MKSTMPYAGITAGVLRKEAKAVFREHPLADAESWLATIAHLWRHARVREERYAALELLAIRRYRRDWLTPDALPLLEEMIRDGAWWDFVDVIASHHLGYLLENFRPRMTERLRTWSRDPDLWIRRASILAQLKSKTTTDTALLTFCIEGSVHDADFFARKAIGWSLREYGKTDAAWVRGFVADHGKVLSPLSKREALKHL